jgi:hypothetical protein
VSTTAQRRPPEHGGYCRVVRTGPRRPPGERCLRRDDEAWQGPIDQVVGLRGDAHDCAVSTLGTRERTYVRAATSAKSVLVEAEQGVAPERPGNTPVVVREGS